MKIKGHTNTADPPKLLQISKYPLWVLYPLGLCLMFLPLLVITSVSTNTLKQTVKLSENVIESSSKEMHHTMKLQFLINHSAMPAHHYLIFANPIEKANFRKTIAAVEQEFHLIFSIRSWSPEDLVIIDQARQEWLEANQLAETILKADNPRKEAMDPELMARYDKLTGRAIDTLEHLHQRTRMRINNNKDLVQAIKSRNSSTLLSITSMALLLAIIGSLVMIRAIFPAIRDIKQGVRLFSQGKLAHRISSNMPPELEEVSAGLNEMATQLQSSYAELERQSIQDSLTGIFNKRKYDLDVCHETSRARRYGHTFSLLMIDLDHFKRVNDTYGHSAGDTVLQQTTQQMGSCLRASDRLYRYGGEEFVILLAETEKDGALAVAERIRNLIASNPVNISNGINITITVSIGVATYPENSDNATDLFIAADAAAYAAK